MSLGSLSNNVPADEACLDGLISDAIRRMLSLPTGPERRQAWEHTKAMIRYREPAHVARLERQLGL